MVPEIEAVSLPVRLTRPDVIVPEKLMVLPKDLKQCSDRGFAPHDFEVSHHRWSDMHEGRTRTYCRKSNGLPVSVTGVPDLKRFTTR